jgi:hypothetical protein
MLRVPLHPLAAGVLAALAFTVRPTPTEACAVAVVAGSSWSDIARPALSHEQVLIVHDPVSGVEHFVREVAFRGGNETFGFIVPTPTRPHAMRSLLKSPFDALRESYPFAPPPPRVREASREPDGAKSATSNGGTVEVLEEKKVGSFTAFVLAANDERALATWLKDNGLGTTPTTEPWLAHYVRMRFFYVALRYNPAPGAATIRSETVAIAFKSPVPYYPYHEPLDAPERASDRPPRLLDLWVASPRPVTPVTTLATGSRRAFVRPFAAGQAWAPSPALRDELDELLGSGSGEPLPEGPLGLQTFQDQKTSRPGFGDVLFAPSGATGLDASSQAALEPLLPTLRPEVPPTSKGKSP